MAIKSPKPKKEPPEPTFPAALTYYIFEGVLTGIVGGRMFHMTAASGGGGGSTKNKPTSSANNPYMEAFKTKGPASSPMHVHGGPIPPGRYQIRTPSKHSHLGLSAELVRGGAKPAGRDGFFIHGRGPHGSDGCIVPLDAAQFKLLMDALIKSKGGVLHVLETMTGGRFA